MGARRAFRPEPEIRRVLCELDASTSAQAVLDEAIACCRDEGAELLVVWVLEPRVFDAPYPGSAGAVGAWGLPHVLHHALERARDAGVAATSAVRVGRKETVLRTEAQEAAFVYRLTA